MYICVYVYMCVYLYVYTYMCIHTHTHIYAPMAVLSHRSNSQTPGSIRYKFQISFIGFI